MAAEYTWDTSAAAGIQAGNGVWGSDNFWTTDGGTTRVGWLGSTHTATFAGSAGTYTVQLSGNIATALGSASLGALNFTTNGYTLQSNSGSLTRTITIGASNAAGSITVASGVTATIGDRVKVTKFGTSGELNLNGGGTLVIGSGTAGGGASLDTTNGANASFINNNSTLEVKTGGIATYGTSLGLGQSAGGGNVNITGGDLKIAATGSSLILQNLSSVTASSTITISSGTIEFTNTANTGGIRFGPSGGSSNALTDLTGTFNLDGGTVTTNKVFMGGSYTNGKYTAVFNFNGGTLKALKTNNTDFMTGITTAATNSASTGVFVKAGGAVIDSNTFDITIGQSLLHDSALGSTLDGGLTKSSSGILTLTGTNTFTGAVTINGGTLKLNSAGALVTTAGSENAIAFGASSTGILQLNGTSRVIKSLSSNATPGSPVVENANSSNITLTVGNSANASGSFAGVIRDGTGGGALALTKTGGGTQTLSGANTYTGATDVTGGTLALTGSGAINSTSGITINGSGAKFVASGASAVSPTVTLTQGTVDGTGSINTVNVANLTGNTVANGNGGTGTLTIGTLAFSGAATVNLVSAGISAPLATTSLSTNAAGTVTINASAASWTNGQTYELISYGGGSIGGDGFGQFALGTVTGTTARQSTTFANSGTAITLAIAGDNPKWTGLDDNGSGSGNWKTGTTGSNKNWKLQTAGTATDFIASDNVLFDDSATGLTSIDINAADVAPTAVEFNNSSLSYMIGSTGGFGISSGSVTKNGSNSVTLSTVNTYTGSTTINAGTFNLTGTLGSTAISVGSAGTFSQSTAGVIGGAASLANSGTTTLEGNNTYSGGTTLNAGILRATTNATALGSGALVLAGGTLQLANDTGLIFGRNTTVSANTQITSDTLTSSAGVTHTLGTLGIGAQTLTIAKGANATGSTAAIVFGSTTLTGASTFSIGADSTLSLGSVANGANTATFTGAGNFVQTGVWGNGAGGITLDSGFSGIATLSQANTYTGATNVNAGTLHVSGSILNSSSVLINGGTLQVSGGNAIGNTGLINLGNAAGATFQVVGSETIGSLSGGGATGGSVSIDASQTLTLSSGTQTYAGTISGSGTLTSAGATQTLSGSLSQGGGLNVSSGVLAISGTGNSYTGTTAISGGGGLVVSANGALGATGTGNATTVASGSQLGLSGGVTYSSTESISGSGAGNAAALGVFTNGSRGFVQSVSGNNTFTGNIEISAAGVSRIGTQNGAQLTLNGPITMASGVTGVTMLFRAGATNGDFVTLASSGNNWDTDTQIFTDNSGTGAGIRLGANNALPTNLSVQANSSTGSGTTLDMASYSQSLNGLRASSAAFKITNSVVSTTSTLTFNNTADLANTNTAIVNGAGAIAVVKSGAFTQSLGATNNYTGTTTIQGGTLLFTKAAALYSNTAASWTPANIIVESGATLGLSVGSVGEFTTSDVGTIVSNLTAVSNNGLKAGSFLGLNVTAPTTVSTLLVDSVGTGGGAVGITKTGGSTLTLDQANTFSGGFNFNAGYVTASNDGALGSGTVTFNNGAIRLNLTDGVDIANDIVIVGGNATGTTSSGLIRNLNNATEHVTISGDITINGPTGGGGGHFATQGAGSTLTLSGAITSSVKFQQRDGTVIYSGGGSYTDFGVTGTARVGANNGLATNATADLGVSASGFLDLAGYNQSLAGITKGTSAATIGNSSTANDSTLTLTGSSTFGGVVQDTLGGGNKKVHLTMNGAAQTLTLTAANTYTGDTTITAGTLALTGTGSIANSANLKVNGTLDVSGITAGTFTVGTSQTLSGNGTINATGRTLEIAGTHAVGNSPGLQTITGNVSYASTSIFEWDLAANVDGTGTRGTDFDAVDITGNLTIDEDATFKVIVDTGVVDFAGSFWTSSQTWSNIWNVTSGTTTSGWLNTAVSVYNTSNAVQDVSGFGSFTITGTSLTWTAVPEPTSALAGLLLGAGLLRRRRRVETSVAGD